MAKQTKREIKISTNTIDVQNTSNSKQFKKLETKITKLNKKLSKNKEKILRNKKFKLNFENHLNEVIELRRKYLKETNVEDQILSGELFIKKPDPIIIHRFDEIINIYGYGLVTVCLDNECKKTIWRHFENKKAEKQQKYFMELKSIINQKKAMENAASQANRANRASHSSGRNEVAIKK